MIIWQVSFLKITIALQSFVSGQIFWWKRKFVPDVILQNYLAHCETLMHFCIFFSSAQLSSSRHLTAFIMIEWLLAFSLLEELTWEKKMCFCQIRNWPEKTKYVFEKMSNCCRFFEFAIFPPKLTVWKKECVRILTETENF